MQKKVILDLCGGTGSWSKPYKKAGYDVRVITWPEHDVITYEPPKNVYGIFAAPPCTQFSFARTNAKKPTDFSAGIETVNACARIIQTSIINQWKGKNWGGFKFWVMENPYGYLVKFLGKPTFEFQPWEFGDRYSKRTCLWGYFNEPKKHPIDLTEEEKRKFQYRLDVLPELPEDYNLPKSEDRRAARRAMTPEHFAEAFFKANQ